MREVGERERHRERIKRLNEKREKRVTEREKKKIEKEKKESERNPHTAQTAHCLLMVAAQLQILPLALISVFSSSDVQF